MFQGLRRTSDHSDKYGPKRTWGNIYQLDRLAIHTRAENAPGLVMATNNTKNQHSYADCMHIRITCG